MTNLIKTICVSVIFLILANFAGSHVMSAIKPFYGGEITLRLNEPEDFSYTPSSYSNLIFFSLIYENFFYLAGDGNVHSHIFKEHRYDKQSRTLNLVLKDNISFSNGDPITPQNVKISLNLFLDMNLASSRKLRRMIKQIRVPARENRLEIELLYDDDNIIASFTTPELVLTSGSDQVFSGMLKPDEWVKNRYIILKPNLFYPGGRSYLDSIKVVFYDFYYPDVFLAEPGMGDDRFIELDAGVYQNFYLTFPEGKVGSNTRIALYSLLKGFFKAQAEGAEGGGEVAKPGIVELNALTSNEESPITLNIRTFSRGRIRSILRYSKTKLYILSSLKKMEDAFHQYIRKRGAPIETLYISDSQLVNYMANTSIKYLLMVKTFNRRMPLEEKIKVILKEMSFARFNETYLKLLNQLDEMKRMQDDELSMNLVSGIIEKIINDGFILPLYQRRYSLYVKKQIKGIILDYYGKPLFRKVRVDR